MQKIQAPTLIIWGKLDPYLMWQMAPASIALCEHGRLDYWKMRPIGCTRTNLKESTGC